MASEPRAHHYVPRFHIARFADERGKVRAYDRVACKHRKNQNPKRVLVKRDLYRAESKVPGEEYMLERILAVGEAQWAPLLNSIVKAGVVEADQIPGLAEYLTLQHARTLNHRSRVRAVADYFTTGMVIMDQRAQRDAGEISDEEWSGVEDDIADINDGKFWLREPDSNILAMQMDALAECAEILTNGWNYVIVSVDRPTFVLSDDPIALLGDWDGTTATDLGIGNAEELWMPLDPRHALVLTRDRAHPRHIFGLSAEHARKINERFVLGSLRWTIYQPGTNPLRGMNIPPQAPRVFVDELAMPATGKERRGSVIQVGHERPHVENEQLLSGRRVVPFPKRDHNFVEAGKPWLPDHERPVDDLPIADIRSLPPEVVTSARRIFALPPDSGEYEVDGAIRFPRPKARGQGTA